MSNGNSDDYLRSTTMIQWTYFRVIGTGIFFTLCFHYFVQGTTTSRWISAEAS